MYVSVHPQKVSTTETFIVSSYSYSFRISYQKSATTKNASSKNNSNERLDDKNETDTAHLWITPEREIAVQCGLVGLGIVSLASLYKMYYYASRSIQRLSVSSNSLVLRPKNSNGSKEKYYSGLNQAQTRFNQGSEKSLMMQLESFSLFPPLGPPLKTNLVEGPSLILQPLLKPGEASVYGQSNHLDGQGKWLDFDGTKFWLRS